MGPKKAMKAMKKNQGLGKPKGVLKKPKAKAKAKASSSKNAALGKAAKAKNDLNKTNLVKLGKCHWMKRSKQQPTKEEPLKTKPNF